MRVPLDHIPYVELRFRYGGLAVTIRMSGPTLRVLALLLEYPSKGLSGAEISKDTGIGSGTLYPLFARLEKAGWIVGSWENIVPQEAGRPRRRYYQLTALGYRHSREALGELQLKPGVLSWNG